MRTLFTIACVFSLVACAASSVPEEEDVVQVEDALQRNDDYTTRDVCTKCGCTATDVACNCGQPPSKKKLECIRNGGPSKVFSGAIMRSATTTEAVRAK